ncbi:hypothetical protein PoB_007083000 [Plakobranchus ocellatus]|uniref:Uncharacterized protein n=1 Tax=Plakobranchus ocellatus TaxID=259542 RepID=A0AAV4DJY8_9GAST|nr:hypothetical protein PoB_007083000 [Plakobranchus ocellatus]
MRVQKPFASTAQAVTNLSYLLIYHPESSDSLLRRQKPLRMPILLPPPLPFNGEVRGKDALHVLLTKTRVPRERYKRRSTIDRSKYGHTETKANPNRIRGSGKGSLPCHSIRLGDVEAGRVDYPTTATHTNGGSLGGGRETILFGDRFLLLFSTEMMDDSRGRKHTKRKKKRKEKKIAEGRKISRGSSGVGVKEMPCGREEEEEKEENEGGGGGGKESLGLSRDFILIVHQCTGAHSLGAAPDD